ncbi:arogenate dehydratase/prephenate dehydratase 1, chloroplastic-like isoform X2 [Apium graveolens]|uniref:arogenate dehydratase/prephenate dehydratase 1, chloroplastic-like isoform X2 n=1 Tax=Apium graveolens TaxID=4045 RepID=UPI003D7928FB
MVPKRKATDIGWEHGTALDGDKRKVKCNYCAKIVSGGITRLKQHVAGISGNVEPCPSAPKEVSDLIRQTFKEFPLHRSVTVKKKNMLLQSSCDEGESSHGHKLVLNVESEDDMTSSEKIPKLLPVKCSTETTSDEEKQNQRHSVSDAVTNSSVRSNLVEMKIQITSSSAQKGGQSPSKIDSSAVHSNSSGQMEVKTIFEDKVKTFGPLSVHHLPATQSNSVKFKISYKGIPGAYSEDAVLLAYPQCETVPSDKFEDVFKAVELSMADKAVIPIENSSSGSIHGNYDLLFRHNLHIVGEVQMPVNLCLLALPGVRTEQLRRILSQHQALTQSDNFLNKLGVVKETVDDEAVSAQLVSSNKLEEVGVIASTRVAEMYGLNLLTENIQDAADNITRFWVLSRYPLVPRIDKSFKTSIVFTLEEGPGELYKALTVFAMRQIELTKIDCRPQRKKPMKVVDYINTGTAKYFNHLYYIDFEASMAESRAQCALGHLKEFASSLRVLGSYPCADVRKGQQLPSCFENSKQ